MSLNESSPSIWFLSTFHNFKGPWTQRDNFSRLIWIFTISFGFFPFSLDFSHLLWIFPICFEFFPFALDFSHQFWIFPICFGFFPHLILSLVAQVGLAERGEEKVFPRSRLQMDFPVRVCVREVTLQARVLCVVNQDHAVHVVGVALWVLDELQGEVESSPEHVDRGDFCFESASPVHSVGHHRLVGHLIGLACYRHRRTRTSFKINCEIHPAHARDRKD